ncbi:MAG: AMP-binding protein [Eubacterium sp.]|nr:AMP-binding protein [Eubacterium sp.]
MEWSSLDIKTTAKLLKWCGEQYAGNPMLVFGEPGNRNAITYDAFYEKARKCAYGYVSEGYDGGKKIALLGENSAQWILHFFAITLSGNVAVLPDKAQTPEFLEKLLKRMDTACIVRSETYKDEGDEIAKALGIDSKSMTWDEVDEIQVPEDFAPEIKEEMPAIIAFTSGTTGEPKGVVISHINLISDALNGLDKLSVSGSTVLLLPLHHMYGIGTCFTCSLLSGVKICINSSLRYIPQDMMEIRPDYLCVVPAVMPNMYPVFGAMKKNGLPIPKMLLSGGAPLSIEWTEKYAALGIPVFDAFGITECAPGIAIGLKPAQGGTVGLDPIMEVRINEPDDKGCGEIIVKGPNVMLEYYGQQEETDKVIADGWFYTGDIGRMDEDGKLFITGRLKNLIILSNGENVAPEELESDLVRNPMIEEVVIRQSDGELEAEVYPADIENFDDEREKAIRAEVSEWTRQYPVFKRVTKVVFRKVPFEKTTTLKIKR